MRERLHDDNLYYNVDINEDLREGYLKGLTEQLNFPNIKGWVARDKDGILVCFF